MTKLQRFQCLKTTAEAAVTWLGTLGFDTNLQYDGNGYALPDDLTNNKYDCVIVRIGKYTIPQNFGTYDSTPLKSAALTELEGLSTACDKFKWAMKYTTFAIDYIKITKYVDDTNNKVYSYTSPFHVFPYSDLYDNTSSYCYYFPDSAKATYGQGLCDRIDTWYGLSTTVPRSNTTWSNSTTYTMGQQVTYGGKDWASIYRNPSDMTNTDNLNHTPILGKWWKELDDNIGCNFRGKDANVPTEYVASTYVFNEMMSGLPTITGRTDYPGEDRYGVPTLTSNSNPIPQDMLIAMRMMIIRNSYFVFEGDTPHGENIVININHAIRLLKSMITSFDSSITNL